MERGHGKLAGCGEVWNRLGGDNTVPHAQKSQGTVQWWQHPQLAQHLGVAGP